VFGVRHRNVARYVAHVAKLDNRSGFIDLFWPGVLLVEQKSVGRDLRKAYEQAGEYFDALPERDRPRFILVSDFQTFELHDMHEREAVAFPLADLPAHVESFGFILGVQRRTFRDQDPANIEAAELVGRLHGRQCARMQCRATGGGGLDAPGNECRHCRRRKRHTGLGADSGRMASLAGGRGRNASRRDRVQRTSACPPLQRRACGGGPDCRGL